MNFIYDFSNTKLNSGNKQTSNEIIQLQISCILSFLQFNSKVQLFVENCKFQSMPNVRKIRRRKISNVNSLFWFFTRSKYSPSNILSKNSHCKKILKDSMEFCEKQISYSISNSMLQHLQHHRCYNCVFHSI